VDRIKGSNINHFTQRLDSIKARDEHLTDENDKNLPNETLKSWTITSTHSTYQQLSIALEYTHHS
jgi:hypothetical protein